MSTDWLGPAALRARAAGGASGALSPATADVHYVSHFRYPSHGGFVSYLDAFVGKTELRLEHEVDEARSAARGR